MAKGEPNLVISGLSGPFIRDGMKVEVNIIRLETEKMWTLEVVNAEGTSIVWSEQFPTDKLAYAEFKRTVSDEDMRTFLDPNNVVPFRR